MDKLFTIIVVFTIAIAAYIVYTSSMSPEDVLENGSSYTANVVSSKPDPSIPVSVSTLPVNVPKVIKTTASTSIGQ